MRDGQLPGMSRKYPLNEPEDTHHTNYNNIGIRQEEEPRNWGNFSF